MPVGRAGGVKIVGVKGQKKKGDYNSFTLSCVHGVSYSSKFIRSHQSIYNLRDRK